VPDRPSPRLFDLTGRVALVTGAAGRVGRVIAHALCEAGAHVVVNGRRPGPIAELADELSRRGPEALAIAADVGVEDDVRRMADTIEARFGRLHVLVNNVTGNHRAPLGEMTVEQWEGALHGALTTMFVCTKVFGTRMAATGGGSIVNIGSIYGSVSPDQGIYGDSGYNPSPVYAAGKGGIPNFTRYVATLWGAAGVRCNTLTIGGVESPWNAHPTFRANYERRTPLGRMARDEDLRGPIVFLASDAAQYVTGTNLHVDGGWTAW
jgi:NAD(P)-dependent dehydrogenase (short-subunit alcohol dehydrogenase family)